MEERRSDTIQLGAQVCVIEGANDHKNVHKVLSGKRFSARAPIK